MRPLLTLLALAALAPPAQCGGGEVVAALRARLDDAPTDLTLRRELDAARADVTYPPGLAPPALGGVRHTVSPLDLLLVSAASGLAVFAGGVLRALGSARRGWAVAAAGAVGWAVLVGVAVAIEVERREASARPALAVAVEGTLRGGNGPNFPPRLSGVLPPGVECVERHRRGGWVQVRLDDGTPDGLAGWLPEAGVIPAAPAARIVP